MKTEIWVSFNYGGWSISFSKTIELSFAPFYGLVIYDKDELTVDLVNDDYTRTIISYDIHKKESYIDVRNVWKRPVADDTIDHELLSFKKAGWKREDDTNIKELKDLMKSGR